MRLFRYLIYICLVVSALSSLEAQAQNPSPPREGSASGHFFKPGHVDADDTTASKFQLPAGFKTTVFAKNLTSEARVMVLAPDGTVYLSRSKVGDIVALRDTDGDGVSDSQTTVAEGLEQVNGLALSNGKLFAVAVRKIFVIDLAATPGSEAAKPKLIVDDLPDAGQHRHRVIRIGPDNMLYVSIASTCNVCDDANKDNATLQKMNLDGTGRKLVAKGLRDTMAFAWHPETNELFGADHGVDWRSDSFPPEEFNTLKEGGNYGWPFCWGARNSDNLLIDDPVGMTKDQYCQATEAPLLTLPAHSAPIDLAFYTGAQYPAEFKNSAFLTLHGSWNRAKASGYKVVQVVFQNGKPVGVKDFMTGFLSADGRNQVGRPGGLLVDKDGSLLVSDDENGVIYRVSYLGARHAFESKSIRSQKVAGIRKQARR